MCAYVKFYIVQIKHIHDRRYKAKNKQVEIFLFMSDLEIPIFYLIYYFSHGQGMYVKHKYGRKKTLTI